MTAVRLHRTRRARNYTPEGAVYVGRPTLWSNPFQGRRKISHARSVILFRAFIAGHLDSYILKRAGFSDAEVAAMWRWRHRLVTALPHLHGRSLQCWCPLTSPWCHADVLLSIAREAE